MASRRKSRKAPWQKAAPGGASHRPLTPKRKAAAKARARKAGRPYPNLVDNMRAAKAAKTQRRAASGRRKRAS
jgi:hypothetical protein